MDGIYNQKKLKGNNLTNILRAAFCMKVFCKAFMCLQFGVITFKQKYIGTKANRKILVKLTTGTSAAAIIQNWTASQQQRHHTHQQQQQHQPDHQQSSTASSTTTAGRRLLPSPVLKQV